MKYKQLVLQKLEQTEQTVSKIKVSANQNNAEMFYESMEKLQEQLNDLRQVVDLEQED